MKKFSIAAAIVFLTNAVLVNGVLAQANPEKAPAADNPPATAKPAQQPHSHVQEKHGYAPKPSDKAAPRGPKSKAEHDHQRDMK